MATMAICLKLARKRYGKNATAEYHANAPDTKERERRTARRTVVYAEKTELDKQIATLDKSPVLADLAKAGRFVVDVDGDEPSIPQLRKAVETAEHLLALREQRQELRKELETLRTYARRCEIGVVNTTLPGFPVHEIMVQADTWEEVAEKLAGKVLQHA